MEEEWRPINGFPKYEVSNFGQVRNASTERILRIQRVNNYPMVPLRRNNRHVNRYVHRLVAEAFRGTSVDGVQVIFIDGDTTNCHIDNLEILYRRAVLLGRRGRAVRVLESGKVYPSISSCAKDLNGSSSAIYAVLNGRAWTYRGLHFRYEDEEKVNVDQD